MKNRFLLLTITVLFAMATFLFWFSSQNVLNQKLEALDKDLIEIKKNP